MIKVINCRVRELRLLGYTDLQDFLDKGAGNNLYVGRDMTQYVPGAIGSKWRNPYTLKAFDGDAKKVFQMYKDYIKRTPRLLNDLHELDGKTLACWCHPDPCHATALKELYEEYVERKGWKTQKSMNVNEEKRLNLRSMNEFPVLGNCPKTIAVNTWIKKTTST